jgi:quercetin dioxygenase-like cupin family protein
MAQASHLYNWNTLPREFVRQGVERCGFRGENVICVMNWVSPGMQIRPHSHTFEQLVVIVEGRVNYHVGDQVFECGPGSMLRVPPNVVHYVEPLGDQVALNLDIFAPIRDDYKHLVEYQVAEFSAEGIS